MEICLQIEKVYFKHHFFLPVFIVSGLCLLSPLLMGVENLDPYQTAKVMEMFFSLMGLILCVPVFLPDFDLSIRELLESKKVPMLMLHILRLLQSLLVLTVILLVFLSFLRQKNCSFPFWEYFLGTMADCLFLGGMGLVVYSISDYVTMAYMIPFLYYIMNIGGGKYLGKFYLFSMMTGSFEETWYLLAVALVFLTVAVGYRTWNWRFR